MTILYIVVALFVGAGLGYGFRGKINKGLDQAGEQASESIQNAAKKI